ncbi:hypothetical protein N657DRAFT_700964 [Parathielavia appendiculata]|uniref:Uncharacterized protein n=1 Tax=Parathielavia appendiculata TaxID=2587402 RepID=A0AAN6TUG7_9PEZI|nr:hypothetical protein N657DRAFT_700964 [Parathielavia appendiculata]
MFSSLSFRSQKLDLGQPQKQPSRPQRTYTRMSFRPLSLAGFFPPKPEPGTQQGSHPSMIEQVNSPELHACDGTVSHGFEEVATSSITHGTIRSASSVAETHVSLARTRAERSSDTWNDTETFEVGEGDEEYWEDDGEESDEDDELDSTDSSNTAKHVWRSDVERMRVAFRRARASARKVDLHRAPFFPQTLDGYVGLKADGIEEKAARLLAKVEAKEKMLRALEKDERNPPRAPPSTPPTLATLPLTYADGHSAILAHPNNPFTPSRRPPTCDWPTTAELTSEGDSRIRRCDPVSASSYYYFLSFSSNDTTTITNNNEPIFDDDKYTPDADADADMAPPEAGHGAGAWGRLGRYLPVPRLRGVIDPRLGLAPQEVDALVRGHGAAGMVEEMSL